MLIPLLTLLALDASIGQTPNAPPRPLIGISPNVKEGGTLADLVKSLQDLRSSGLDAMCVSVKWSELEPEKGRFDLSKIDDPVRGLGGLGFTLAVTIQTLDTNNRTLPADLMDRPFNSPEMRARWGALLRAVAPRLTDRVRWVMLGNEADVYLALKPGELESYAGFVEEGRRLVRELKPGLPVGVTCTYDGARGRPTHFQRLSRETDVAALTYYPLNPDFSVRPVSGVAGDVGRMVEMAGGKPLLLQEAGYPADPLLGSSEEQQAAFVDALFDAAGRHGNRIVLVNYFLLVDFNDALLAELLKYYRLPNPRFRAFLATLGLHKADGTPRKAWERFRARLKTRNR